MDTFKELLIQFMLSIYAFSDHLIYYEIGEPPTPLPFDSALDLASLVAQRLKRLPAVQETRVWSLSQEDPLEKEMATHSSIFAWRSRTRLSHFTSLK